MKFENPFNLFQARGKTNETCFVRGRNVCAYFHDLHDPVLQSNWEGPCYSDGFLRTELVPRSPLTDGQIQKHCLRKWL